MIGVTKHAHLVFWSLSLATVAAGYYAITEFSMNSDTGRLIRQDTDWKKTHTRFVDTFPQYDQNSFVVVSGSKPDMVSKVTRALAAEIRTHEDIFRTVYTPSSNEFVDEYALLFLETDKLNDTVSKLADAQPFLTAIAEDNSLRSALELVIEGLTADEDLPVGFEQMADALVLAADRALIADDRPVSWRDELFQVGEDETYYQVIFIQGQQDFGKDLPNGLIIEQLETSIEAFEHPYKTDVLIRLTGQVPLEHGEIVSAMTSAQLAGSLALVILIFVLVWGVRSLRIIAATYLSMIYGLVWTAAFAMATVGQYNTISIIFLVMFIGLGVDFAVHLCLRYQEALTHTDKQHALIETGVEIGPAIILCGITSAMGFLAFVPTDYIGLAEMGIISGGGMIFAVIISLTLIPAFFAMVKEPREPARLPFANFMTAQVAGHHTKVAWCTLVLALVLIAIASFARFDYSTLALKDPKSEAMTTLRDLHDEDIITDYALTYLATSLDHAEETKEYLLALDVVSEVKTPNDYIPDDQDEKLYVLEDAGFLLGSVFYPNTRSTPFTDQEFAALLSELATETGNELNADPDTLTDSMKTSLLSLQRSISALATGSPEQRALFSALIVPPIKQEISWLESALSPSQVTLDTLPTELKERLISPDGQVVVSITPAEDVVPVEVMRRFTESVLTIVPDVTGRPVLDLGIGDIVITAFQTAISLAIAGIFVVLLITLRSALDAVLVFIPLVMTAMVTLSVSVLIDLPLNMANVVVIPLIFGLGVDNGIHIVKRYHQIEDINEFVDSSTPKAVFLSNLTTLGTFCALSLSTHQGIYSIGVLLTVALLSLMFLTLVSLPALLATFSEPRSRTQPV
jgi:hopanoid biosynthesis associated RND transporter like protein HpnN